MTRPVCCLFPKICCILIVTFFSCLGTTLVKGDSELEYENGTLWTVNICEIKELNLGPNVTTRSVLLYTGEKNNTGECSVTVKVVEGTVQFGIHLQSVFDYSSNYVYIDTSPNNSNGYYDGRIVAFPTDWDNCFITLTDDFKIYLKGDSRVTLQVSNPTNPVGLTKNVTHHIPDEDKGNETCTQPMIFKNVVYCHLYEEFEEYYRPITNITACDFICPINASCVLDHRTITTSYPNNSSQYNSLLIYPEIHKVTSLFWAERRINALTLDTFDGFHNLETLFLFRNRLIEIYPGLFNSLIKLRALYLYQTINEIRPGNVFNDLSNLERLYLEKNGLRHLEADVFKGLTRLTVLRLHKNYLTELHPSLFADLTRVYFLSLNENMIRKLSSQLFKSGVSLQILKLADNHLTTLESDIFQACEALENLDLRGNDLKWIEKTAFRGIHNTTKILVDDYGTCCFVTSTECYAVNPKPVYLTCERLLSKQLMRIIMWVLGFGALFSNVLILIHWLSNWRRNQIKENHFLLMTNLSLSDFLMGIYLLILTSVDAYYADFFPAFAEKWRQSGLCKVAGTLSVLSSQGSVFFITLISFDRYMSIKYPFSQFRLQKRSLKLVIIMLWISAFLIAAVPTFLSNVNPDVYDVSEVCIGLPLSRKLILSNDTHTVRNGHNAGITVDVTVPDIIGTKPGMYYSMAIFIVLNLTCFLVVAFCYIQIFITVRKSHAKSGRSKQSEADLRMAINMSAVVLTDFCCWVPIIITCILVQCGLVVVSPVMYAWTVAFILPINSSVNPVVYSGVTKIMDANCLKWQFSKNKDTNMTRNASNIAMQDQNRIQN